MSSPLPFVLFCLAVAILYQISTAAVWRRSLLLAASALYIASFSRDWRAYAPLLLFVVFGYVGLKWIQSSPKAFLPVLLLTIAAFVWIKQYVFLPHAWTLSFPYITIGLSYLFFRVLHLMIAARNNALPENPGFLTYFHYTANFLTLASGPIQLFPDYVKNRDKALTRRVSFAENAEGIERIIKGLFKASVIALVFTTIRTKAMDAVLGPGLGTGAKLGYGILIFAAYPLFLYFNFSGFIDLVIGAGRLLGVTLPENFNRPFAADNFMDFWSNRWHITLSSWVKSYVYNPLLIALMRRIPSQTWEPFLGVFAFFVTFFLVGVWHGQNSEMILFGVLLGLGVSVNKLFQLFLIKLMGRKPYNALSSGASYVAFSRGLTFTYVAMTLILFWSNWQQIHQLEQSLGVNLMLAVCAAMFLGATVLISLWETARAYLASFDGLAPLQQYTRTALSTGLLVAVLVITLLMNQQAPDIVYKGF